MGKVTISVYEFMKKFSTAESARRYLERKRWKGKPVCPNCGCMDKQYKQKKNGKEGYYLC